MSLDKSLKSEALKNLIINTMALPGYFVSIALIDTIGKFNLQYLGFIAVGFIFILIRVL